MTFLWSGVSVLRLRNHCQQLHATGCVRRRNLGGSQKNEFPCGALVNQDLVNYNVERLAIRIGIWWQSNT